MVSAQTMVKFCKDLGTPTFVILMANLTLPQVPTAGQTAQMEEPNTLGNILAEYREFHDMFSGEKASTLTPHRPYDL